MNQYSWTREERAIYDQAKKRDDDNVSCLKQKLHEGIEIGREEGREEGEKQAKIAVAKNSLKAGVSIDVIAEITGLSIDEIKQLQEELA